MKQAPVLKDEQVKKLLKTTRITRHPGLIQDWIAMIWEHLDGSSRHWSGYHNLRRADEEAIDKAVFHLSYLAKTRGKGFRPPQTKDYGWTRSICASKRPLSNAKGEE